MILAVDIISFKRTTYGKAGDCVELVSRHGSVLIVADRNGERFPIGENELQVDEVSASIAAPRAPAKAKSAKKQSVPLKISETTGQQNLF